MLNVQIIPAPAQTPDIPGVQARVMLIPARGRWAEEQECPVCRGEGRLPRGDACRKCGGAGRAKLVEALRLDVEEMEAAYEAVADYLDTVGDDPEQRIQRTIRLVETGGGATNTGSAQIVAGMHGEKLVSMGGRGLCNGAHAVFFVHVALVINFSHHRGAGSGTVARVGVDRKARHHIGVESALLWRFTEAGWTGDIEATEAGRASALEFPDAAVEAAIGKSRDYHCRSAWYAAAGGASGPSGALTGAGAAYGGLPSPYKGPGIGYEPRNA